MIPTQPNQYQAYAQAKQTVGKLTQLIMLYDGAIRFLRQAREAIEQDRIEDRYNLLIRASDVIMGMQASLDFENGGEISQILHDFYSSLDARILMVHRNNSLKLCDQVIDDMKQMRATWQQIEEEDTSEASEVKEASESSTQPSAQSIPVEGGVSVSA
jgi:flagellar protein FliS